MGTVTSEIQGLEFLNRKSALWQGKGGRGERGKTQGFGLYWDLWLII